MLEGKKIVIAVTGSIAAYKIAFLTRLLVKEKAEVQIIMTESAKDFITPLTLSTLSQKPVLVEPFNPVDGRWNSHVDLGNWADVMLFAPLSANSMAKMANGIADNFVMTVYLSAKCPVFIAPAMDLDMFKHPSTQHNLKVLSDRGHHLIEPQVGELASGLSGAGRMEEPDTIVEILKAFFKKKNDLNGKTILISAGPTHEAIDPVRFIGNHSSGKMGFALANEAASRGARVFLVSGPTSLELNNQKIEVTKVVSAQEMYEACISKYEKADICIMAAAVADYTPKKIAKEKIKKSEDSKSIRLKPTTDIVLEIGKRKKSGQFLVGFALETENEKEHALSKLDTKNLDMIVLNSLQDKGAGFGHDTNKVTIFEKNRDERVFGLKSKKETASDILDAIVESYIG